jgi:hypothetical protein
MQHISTCRICIYSDSQASDVDPDRFTHYLLPITYYPLPRSPHLSEKGYISRYHVFNLRLSHASGGQESPKARSRLPLKAAILRVREPRKHLVDCSA